MYQITKSDWKLFQAKIAGSDDFSDDLKEAVSQILNR